MKLQKGILDEPAEQTPAPRPELHPTPVNARPSSQTRSAVVHKDRLFETLDKESTSSRSYAKLLLVAAVVVLIAGGVIFYMTLPGAGDQVSAPKALEQAVRNHLHDNQKRVATDITFYYCGGDSYWARSGVEVRTDIPNPIYRLDKYAVSAKGKDPNWEITSKPMNLADDDKPCT